MRKDSCHWVWTSAHGAREVDKLSRWIALIASQGNPMSILTEGTMKQSQNFLENADNCDQLAERAADGKPSANLRIGP
jgi:hypothetical protein